MISQTPAQFFFRKLEVRISFLEISGVPGQIDQVENGFKRIVDFMRDGRRKRPDSGHLFLVLKDLFRTLAVADVLTDMYQVTWSLPS